MYYQALLVSALACAVTAAPPVKQHAAPQAAKIRCPIMMDGRMPSNMSMTAMDTENGIFNPGYVKGNNVTWSQILKDPQGVTASRFDTATTKPLEVTIDDRSIFMKQFGFRRAGLQFASDGPEDATDTGVITLHWSVKQNAQSPLNLTHEYLNVWHETADYSANQFNFNTGTRIGTDGADKTSWQLLSRSSSLLWSTPINMRQWQNFAITIDYTQNTLAVYTSIGNNALKLAGGPFPNDNSGAGQFQIGILKKPTGSDDVVNSGYQSSGFLESQIYGGIFVEDSAGGCISL